MAGRGATVDLFLVDFFFIFNDNFLHFIKRKRTNKILVVLKSFCPKQLIKSSPSLKKI